MEEKRIYLIHKSDFVENKFHKIALFPYTA